MKFAKRWVCLLIITLIFVTLITPVSLGSSKEVDQEITLFYPNSDWLYTPIITNLSFEGDHNYYLAALQKLAEPDSLPVNCYDEFPESFQILDVETDNNIAYVTLSDAAMNDPNLSNGWQNTLGDIISFNLFNLDKNINTVEFLPYSSNSKRKIKTVDRQNLFSEITPKKIKTIPSLEIDTEALKKLSKEERNKKVQEAIDNLLGEQSIAASVYTICIDPGHGGSDPGAVAGGVEEADLNLDISLAIQDYLSDVSWPTFDVLMTRTTDVKRSLTYRHDLANNNNADIFISVHCNTFTNPSTRGVTARYPNNHDMADSQVLGNACINGVESYSSIPKHSDANYQSIQVIREATMPATLVECGFMTNSSDLTALLNEDDDIGLGIGVNANFWCQANL